jgi:hypothetical protein
VSRKAWIIVLVAVGVGLAVLIGVLGRGNNEPTAEESTASLCSSLSTFEASVNALTNIDPSTTTTAEFQTDVKNVQADWADVTTAAQDAKSAQMGSLDAAWAAFESSVQGIPSDSTVQDAANTISKSADTLASSVQSTAQSADCSSG